MGANESTRDDSSSLEANSDSLQANSDSLQANSETERHVAAETLAPSADRRSVWIVAAALLLLALALNWPYQHTYTSRLSMGAIDSVIDFKSTKPSPPVVGGWPYRYFVGYSSEADRIQAFSIVALAYNLGLAAIASALLIWYVHRRSKRSSLSVANLTIADLLLLTVFLAAPFGWWQQLGARHDEELAFAKSVQRQGGACVVAASVPQILEKRIPKSLALRLRRIHAVRMEHASDDLVKKFAALSELSTLRLGGGDYSLSHLANIAARLRLEDLRVAGRQLDTESLQAIRSCVRLHTLNLMRTNVTSEALMSLDTMPQLTRMSLIHSDVVTAEITSPPWSDTIETLRLPHPEPGDEASFRISGWPNLKTIEINEYDTQMNSALMKVELEDLPSLSYLGLDLFQKFDLTLRNLPLLKDIVKHNFEWTGRISRGGKAPGLIWANRLEFDRLPELEKFQFFTPDLKFCRFTNTPKFQALGIAAFHKTFGNQQYEPELTKEAATALIQGIGKSDGPEYVNLDAVPLEGVDLTPLTENKKLSVLKLSYSKTKLKQWKQLEPMTWLKTLTVQGNEGSAEAMPWVMKNFPKLENFAFSSGASNQTFFYGGSMESFEVVDRPELKSIDMGDVSMNMFSSIRIVNSPNLSMKVKAGNVDHLELVNAESLDGLAVNGSFPRDAKLSGLKNLEYFAAGGPNVTDQVLESIIDCKSLRRLTLAYPSVSKQGLVAIKNFTSLVSLDIPGTPLTDEIVEKWGTIQGLTALDLSDTEITHRSLKKLTEGKFIERIGLDNTNVDPSELGVLADCFSLSDLSLAGVGIDGTTLGKIMDSCDLRVLDLSDSNVTPEVMDAIATKGNSLTFLSLRNTELDEKKLSAIAMRNPHLKFELSGANASTRMMTKLLSARRITTAEELEMEQSMQAMNYVASTAKGFVTYEPMYPAIINTRNFARVQPQAVMTAPFPARGRRANNPGAVNQAPLGTRLGNWIGQALLGNSTEEDMNADDGDQTSELEDEPDPSDTIGGDTLPSEVEGQELEVSP